MEDILTKILIIKVDLMVCVTTSKTLLNAVLFKAGQSIKALFDQQYNPPNPLLLDGGSTEARHILFAPWQLSAEQSDPTRDKQVYHSI